MPTYQYVCTECSTPLEAVQKFTDEPLTDCPTCGGKLRKVFSSVGIVFKGSGFYRTDSRAGSAVTRGVGVFGRSSSSSDVGRRRSSGDSTSTKPDTAAAAKTPRRPLRLLPPPALRRPVGGSSSSAPAKSSPKPSGGSKSGGSKSAANN